MAEPNAKFITRAYVGGQKVAVSDHWVVLQAKSPGTCQITINQSAERFTPVAFEMGWGQMIDRLFFGYIERIMPAANGHYTAFCRELSSGLANNLSVMLRQPTLSQVCEEITAITGLEFVLPDKPYTKTAIPCFYADTSGYAMLDNLGRCFKIQDFIWQQQGNGKIYVGSYADSYWHGKNIAIPQNLMTEQEGGKTAEIPATPKLRPNATANGQRITKTEFKGTNMKITW